MVFAKLDWTILAGRWAAECASRRTAKTGSIFAATKEMGRAAVDLPPTENGRRPERPDRNLRRYQMRAVPALRFRVYKR